MRWSSSLFALLSLGLGVACTAEAPPLVTTARAVATCNSADDCAAAVSRDPTDPHLRVRWARALEEASKATMAAREFRGALRLATDESAPIDEAASGLIRLGDAAGCVIVLDAQIEDARRAPGLMSALQSARERCVEAAKKSY